ncbi:hypothetical protein ACFC5Z_09795 [Streptomyces sp. NPDC056004]|uniref:hypothetical protein n=1 Tax=Streptomyces sp. NPDC056004 TaxID=3345677 RepID=UPI0035E1E57C
MGLASLLLLLTIAGYAALCAARPFGPCRKCRGTGQTDTRKGAETCRRCHGARYRLRVGRRIHNHAERIHTTGSRPGLERNSN